MVAAVLSILAEMEFKRLVFFAQFLHVTQLMCNKQAQPGLPKILTVFSQTSLKMTCILLTSFWRGGDEEEKNSRVPKQEAEETPQSWSWRQSHFLIVVHRLFSLSDLSSPELSLFYGWRFVFFCEPRFSGKFSKFERAREAALSTSAAETKLKEIKFERARNEIRSAYYSAQGFHKTASQLRKVKVSPMEIRRVGNLA